MDYKAFVSSTFVDLKEHRARAIAALRKAGIHVDPMEDWTADTDEPKRVSVQRMRDCDVCVLLVGARRGHIPDGEQRSVTQLEVAEAERLGIDVLPFLYDGQSPWPPAHYEIDRDEQLRNWRAHLMEHQCVATFTHDPTSIDGPLQSAIARWIHAQSWPELHNTYLETIAAIHSSIRFLGIGHQKVYDRPIADLFIEPHTSSALISPDDSLENSGETLALLETVSQSPRLILLGDPGSGKSTLVSWIVWSLANPDANVWKTRLGNLTPLPFILRDLALDSVSSWRDMLQAGLAHWSLRLLGRSRYAGDVETLFESGRAIFLLDGLDEISDAGVRQSLALAVRQGMEALPACRWLLTSRVVGFDDIAKILKSTESAVRYVAPFTNDQIRQFAVNWHTTRDRSSQRAHREAESLVNAIESNDYTSRLARTPHLLTMMALIHRERAKLPDGRALLYADICNAYLQSIDEQRRIQHLGYNLLDQKRLLGRVGFEMQKQRSTALRSRARDGAILVGGEDLRAWLLEAMDTFHRTGNAQEAATALIDELCRRSGLLIPRGEDQFSFSHLSFQEYFAAVLLLQQLKLPPRKRRQGAGIAGADWTDLPKYAEDYLWRETLTFLLEATAAEEPDLVEDVVYGLFGESFANVLTGSISSMKWDLLAGLVVNPHSGFDQAGLKLDGIDHCCRAALRFQKGKPFHQQGAFVLPTLFRSDADTRAIVWTKLVDTMRLESTRAFTFREVPVSDVSPLERVDSLRHLGLSEVKMTDLTSVTKLRHLELVHLYGLYDIDVTPLRDLPKLKVLRMVSSKVKGLEEFKKARPDCTIDTQFERTPDTKAKPRKPPKTRKRR